MRIAVVEHITLGRVPAAPRTGEIAHLEEPRFLPAGIARRPAPRTRDLVMITDGERTIVVVGEPLHPLRSDALPWERLAACAAAYFTAQDPLALQAARVLVVTVRRR